MRIRSKIHALSILCRRGSFVQNTAKQLLEQRFVTRQHHDNTSVNGITATTTRYKQTQQPILSSRIETSIRDIHTMVERQQHKEKQKQQQQELLSGQVDQYQTTSVHVGPHKQDKIYSVQRETLKDGLKHIQESYDKIYHVYNREFLTTSDKYGKKNALQILIRLVSVQLAIEDSLLIPMAHDLLEDGYRWSETCRNGIFAMKDAMITLWRSIGTSEFTDETDQLTKQLFEQRLKKHSDIIVQSIVPLLSDKLTAMQRDEMFHLMSNAQSQERHFPISSELKMNWLSGHDMNLFEKFVENVKKEAHTMEKTVYTPKLGYHK